MNDEEKINSYRERIEELIEENLMLKKEVTATVTSLIEKVEGMQAQREKNGCTCSYIEGGCGCEIDDYRDACKDFIHLLKQSLIK